MVMKSIITIIVLLCFVSLPNPSVGLKKPWPKPSDLASHHDGDFGDSKVAWACSSTSDPNTPPSPPGSLPNIPKIPQIPGIPNIPEIPPIPEIPQIPQIPQIPGIPQIPQIPNIPQIPQIPEFPIIPGLPNIQGLPRIPYGPYQSVLVSQSSKLEKCLKGDNDQKAAEKCFSQIFSSWAENDFALDKDCCEIVVKMDKECNGHFHMMFKSHFFAPLLQYSCHIKHAKKN